MDTLEICFKGKKKKDFPMVIDIKGDKTVMGDFRFPA